MSGIGFVIVPQKSEKWKTKLGEANKAKSNNFYLENVYFYLWKSSFEAFCGGLRVSWLLGARGLVWGDSGKAGSRAHCLWDHTLTRDRDSSGTWWRLSASAWPLLSPFHLGVDLNIRAREYFPRHLSLGICSGHWGCWCCFLWCLGQRQMSNWASVRKLSGEVNPV